MSSVVDKLTSIGESISSLFDALNPFSDNFILIPVFEFFEELLSYLNPFSDNFILKILFNWISDLIHEIFVPDTESINQQFSNTLSNLKGRLGITIYNLDNLFDASAKPTDVTANYNIYGVGTMELPFANYKFLADGVHFFRPFIRGLLVLLLFFFNVRQFMSMFGLDSGEMSNWVSNSRGRDEK